MPDARLARTREVYTRPVGALIDSRCGHPAYAVDRETGAAACHSCTKAYDEFVAVRGEYDLKVRSRLISQWVRDDIEALRAKRFIDARHYYLRIMR